MMRSLYAAISGLRNHQEKMDVIGNNIANVNTVGFKSGSVTFQDMLSQTLSGASSGTGTSGGTNPMQIGLGVSVAAISTNFTDGSAQSTGVQTDLAITGSGFFVLGDPLNQQYSRAGNFSFDASGNLVNGSGMKVLGWQGNNSGVVSTTGAVTGIQIPVGSVMPAKVSSTLTAKGNLSASATAYGTAAQRAAATLASSTATTASADATTASASVAAAKTAADAVVSSLTAGNAAAALAAANIAVIDATTAKASATAALANATATTLAVATAALTAANTALADATALQTAANTTNTTLTAANASAAQAAGATAVASANAAATATNTNVAAATAAVTAANDKSSDQLSSINLYDSQGNAYKLNGTFEKTGANTWSFTPAATITDSTGATIANVTTSATPIAITFNSSGVFQTSTAATIKVDPTGLTPPSPYTGAGAFTVTPDFSTMTQYGTDSTANLSATDGYTAGTLTAGGGITISTDGTIEGTFTNGKKMDLAKIAIASFNNPGGLMKNGDSLYAASSNSGQPQIGTPGTAGRGTFTPGSLEMSNVDLAQQFADMIVTQRGFQANSKIITTDDTMLDDLINMKR
jgi:flagellar hook protein FlgE